jgi:Putative auto-transporter adhesin, head GIN domain
VCERRRGPVDAMANSIEPRGKPSSLAIAMEPAATRVPTSSAVGSARACVAGATRMARSARGLRAAALLAGALAGCEPYVQGNGVYHEERRPTGAFTGVHVGSGIDATVTAGAPSGSVTVSGDANVVPYIEAEVRTDSGREVLFLQVSRVFSGTIPARAVIEIPALEYAFATDGAKVTGKRVAAASFQVVADRGSNVVLEGAATPAGDTVYVRLGTGALLDATAYVSGGATVQLSGGSIARLHSDGAVNGTVTDGSLVDNFQGAGSCAGIVADGASRLNCR